MDVAGADVMADADTVANAEAGHGVGQASRRDGVEAVADGVVEEGEVGVELAGGDQRDEGLDGIGGQPRMVVRRGVESAMRELPAEGGRGWERRRPLRLMGRM